MNRNEVKHEIDTEHREVRHVTSFDNWEKLYQLDAETEQKLVTIQSKIDYDNEDSRHDTSPFKPIQLHQKYILMQIKNGFILIDQNRAHQRILFEQYIQQLEQKQSSSQQILFPRTIELSANDYQIVQEILEDLKRIGFEIEPFGKNSIIVHGTPVELAQHDEAEMIEMVLQNYKDSMHTDNLDKHQKLAKSLAYHTAVKPNTILDDKSMQNIVDSLFACTHPTINPVGLKTYITYTSTDIQQLFDK